MPFFYLALHFKRGCGILQISPEGGYLRGEVHSMSEEAKKHYHHHDEAHMKAVINRMSRAIGHFESVKRMVENGEDCTDVLIQLAAVKSAVNNIGKEILKEHLSHCIVDAVNTGDDEAVKMLNTAIDRFMK